MQPKQIGTLVALYIATSAIAFGGFKLAFANGAVAPAGSAGGGLANLISPSVPKSSGGVNVDSSLPKTEECPINGAMYTKPEAEAWAKRRPLAVMIENHMDARPQSGLSKADVIYEAVAEGGITRFMGLFYCAAQAKDTIVAPVRSARSYFIEWASDYNNPLYVHVGGANNFGNDGTDKRVQALEQLTTYGWAQVNDIDGRGVSYPVFARNYNRIPGKDLATEHTMESSTSRVWEFAATKRGLTNKDKKGTDWSTGFVKWSFADDAAASGATQKISYEFWEGFKQFAVQWDYDATSNSYLRTMAGEKHVDLNDGKQLATKNVVILFTKEEGPVDIHKHMWYQTAGSGKAIIFQNGKRVDATWSKKDRTSRLTFTDAKGKSVPFVRGQVWISVLQTNTPVDVQ